MGEVRISSLRSSPSFNQARRGPERGTFCRNHVSGNRGPGAREMGVESRASNRGTPHPASVHEGCTTVAAPWTAANPRLFRGSLVDTPGGRVAAIELVPDGLSVPLRSCVSRSPAMPTSASRRPDTSTGWNGDVVEAHPGGRPRGAAEADRPSTSISDPDAGHDAWSSSVESKKARRLPAPSRCARRGLLASAATMT
jgi:hypothetical protein